MSCKSVSQKEISLAFNLIQKLLCANVLIQILIVWKLDLCIPCHVRAEGRKGGWGAISRGSVKKGLLNNMSSICLTLTFDMTENRSEKSEVKQYIRYMSHLSPII